MDDISIGYLSWKRHNVLEQTLNSHIDNGLFDIIKKITESYFSKKYQTLIK